LAQIIVTGANGQLGRSLQACKQLQDVRYLSHNDLDICDGTAIRQLLNEEKPSWLINCAAYTAVDAAESNSTLAYAINGRAVQTLADSCLESDTHLLHISTDYVFSGEGNRPHTENAVVHPEGVYAKSKRMGEVAVLNSAAGLVLRTSWLYSYYERNFFRTILKKCLGGAQLRVVSDQIGTPTWAGNLARAICQIVSNNQRLTGVYHFSDLGTCSWFDFACYIRKVAGTSNEIIPIRTSEWQAAAPRPQFSVLDSAWTRALLHLDAENWLTGVEHCYNSLVQLKEGRYFHEEYK